MPDTESQWATINSSKVENELTWKWRMGALLTKKSGSSWTGRVVGFYSTRLTPIGYAIESINEPGSVQIYPEKALTDA